MSVKSAQRILDFLGYFASSRAPASLTELSEALGLPKSSCLALISTLEQSGYLYQVHPRVGYYPTTRWYDQARVIAAHDPVIHRLDPFMRKLRDRTGETVILGRRAGNRVVYIAVLESEQTVRYTAYPGQLKPLYGTASGKAVLASLDVERRRRLLRELPLKPFTPRTITAVEAIERDLERGAARGWHHSVGEHVPDVTAIAAIVEIQDDYVLVVAGPTHRMSRTLEATGAAVARACRDVEAAGRPARTVRGRGRC